MKCPSCGAEIVDAKYCEYCGTQITSEMQREQEILNKQGCPKCGSTNIQFKRENQGEIRSNSSKRIIHKTVGFCKDCGATWFTEDVNKNKKRNYKIILWILGWIFIFPLPLTLLLIKKKELSSLIKYGIIAIAWIVYVLIGIGAGVNSKDTKLSNSSVTTQVVETAEITSQ